MCAEHVKWRTAQLSVLEWAIPARATTTLPYSDKRRHHGHVVGANRSVLSTITTEHIHSRRLPATQSFGTRVAASARVQMTDVARSGFPG